MGLGFSVPVINESTISQLNRRFSHLAFFFFQRLTGGTLLSRDSEYIVFYRGKDFLPLAVSTAIEERRKSAEKTAKVQEESNKERETSEEESNEERETSDTESVNKETIGTDTMPLMVPNKLEAKLTLVPAISIFPS